MFDIEKFKTALQPFGTINYAMTFNDGAEDVLEFVVDDVNYLYAVANFGEFTTAEILPYYPNLIVLSMDKIRLKGVFKK